MEARLPFSSDYAVTVRGYGSVGEGADCPKEALNRLLVQDAIAVGAALGEERSDRKRCAECAGPPGGRFPKRCGCGATERGDALLGELIAANAM